jgi:pSer/pThr/pTyr-binding forkhead associated (FHA) protein
MVAPGATIALERLICPVCKADGIVGQPYCPDCGFLLGSEVGALQEVADVSQRPRLRDPKTGAEHILKEGENSVGRERSDVLLQDASVSRKHAKLILDGDSILVTDIGSTNGTFVNGCRIPPSTEQKVLPGDEITFGSLSLVLDVPGADVPAGRANISAAILPSGDEVSSPQEFPEGTFAKLEPVTAGAPTLYLFKEEIQLGRSGGDILLSDDPSVSRTHCFFCKTEQGVCLVDKGSSNGTYVNDVRLVPFEQKLLSEGDLLTIGRRKWRFIHYASTEEPVEVREDILADEETIPDAREASEGQVAIE